ncbi:hypothetical protein MANES_15G187401v8 [Manihot esculenta]|uniref:Uncharacterized protein n=1 Tax=Manihot esculenta TaxID=3983 RepID=A0ACB7GDH8_MANES|nr:hypothetical protein MANES_15G187401v8 [Manihot esculenta]
MGFVLRFMWFYVAPYLNCTQATVKRLIPSKVEIAESNNRPVLELLRTQQSSNINALKYLVSSYKPDILFLMETKALNSRMKFFRSFLHFDDCFSVNRQELGGDLSLM